MIAGSGFPLVVAIRASVDANVDSDAIEILLAMTIILTLNRDAIVGPPLVPLLSFPVPFCSFPIPPSLSLPPPPPPFFYLSLPPPPLLWFGFLSVDVRGGARGKTAPGQVWAGRFGLESVGACKDMKRIFFLFVLEVEFGLVELCLARVFVGDFNLLGICAGCFFFVLKGLTPFTYGNPFWGGNYFDLV